MKRIAAAVLLLALSASAHAAETLRLSDLAGDWIDASYAAALAATRSPLAAEKKARVTAFSLRQEKGQWRLFATDFHEGYWRIALRLVPVSAGAYDLVVGENASEDVAKTHALRITAERQGGEWLVRGAIFGDEAPGKYRRIAQPAEKWANRLLLAGRYTDQRGRPVAFSPEGVASFPGQPEFKYDVVLDTSEACCDYVNTSRKPHGDVQDRIAYRWQGDRLALYDVITNPEDASGCPIRSAKEPFAILRRR